MAIASTLTPQDVITQNLRVSNATVKDVAFYDVAAYKRMSQITKEAQDSLLKNTLFPKASIELLTMLEVAWWPAFAYNKGYQPRQNMGSKSFTAFNPSKLLKMNQTLIQLEVYKAVEIFFSTIVTDNANLNEKDTANHKFAMKRFTDEWNKAKQESFFYDIDQDGKIDALEENLDTDESYFSGDRRYY
jgi:hypothetical protein